MTTGSRPCKTEWGTYISIAFNFIVWVWYMCIRRAEASMSEGTSVRRFLRLSSSCGGCWEREKEEAKYPHQFRKICFPLGTPGGGLHDKLTSIQKNNVNIAKQATKSGLSPSEQTTAPASTVHFSYASTSVVPARPMMSAICHPSLHSTPDSNISDELGSTAVTAIFSSWSSKGLHSTDDSCIPCLESWHAHKYKPSKSFIDVERAINGKPDSSLNYIPFSSSHSLPHYRINTVNEQLRQLPPP